MSEQQNDTAQGQPEAQQSVPENATERPDYLPEQFWKDGTADVQGLAAAHSELSAFKAVQDARAAQVPAEASAYGFDLPEGFEQPEGLEFSIGDDDPRREPLQQWACEAGVTADDFSKLIGIYAKHEASGLMQIKERATAEMEKLGGNGAGRVAGIYSALKGSLPQAQAQALADSLTTAEAVRAVEKLIQNAAGANPPAAHDQTKFDPAPFGRNASERLDTIMLKGTN